MNEPSDSNANKPAKVQPDASPEPSTQAHGKHSGTTDKPKKTGIILAMLIGIIALCLGIGLSIGGWSLYQQQLSLTRSLSSKVQSLESDLQTSQAELERGQAQLMQKAPWKAPIKSLDKQIQQRLSAQKEVIESLEAKFKKIQPSDLMEWQISQLEFYLLLAQKRLALTEDAVGASLLLEEAIKVGEQIKDPDILPLIKTLLKDRANLKISSFDNRDQIISRLQILIQILLNMKLPSIDKERLSNNPSTDATDSQSANPEHSETQSKFMQLVSSAFIRVQKIDEAVSPLVNVETQKLAQQQAIVLISQAQLYLMNRDLQSFQESLNSAQQLLNRTFKHPSQKAKFASLELDALTKLTPEFKKVNLEPSLDAYRNYTIVRKRRQSNLKSVSAVSSANVRQP